MSFVVVLFDFVINKKTWKQKVLASIEIISIS